MLRDVLSYACGAAPALQVINLSPVTVSLINELVICFALLFQCLAQLLQSPAQPVSYLVLAYLPVPAENGLVQAARDVLPSCLDTTSWISMSGRLLSYNCGCGCAMHWAAWPYL
jgi:hypothetical protein